ncbi:hypothetical protein Axi01nite_00180 [Actinoplanes xinjiangensis]|nr:hypothetical protein Axi01nite_00180 [Actinoplanes xinjiangensis]
MFRRAMTKTMAALGGGAGPLPGADGLLPPAAEGDGRAGEGTGRPAGRVGSAGRAGQAAEPERAGRYPLV